MNVAVIIPALNEADSIGHLIEALLAQTRRPDEIIVSDGGSSDGTRAIVESYGPPVRLVIGPGGISENRNAAIAATDAEIIACTDAGCIPDGDWLEKITAPFEDGAKWVAGMSRPANDSPLQAAIGLSMMPVPDEIDVRHFVPGGASQAFLKSVWTEAGGFPEGMIAGEDTLFGEQIRQLGIRPVVVQDAQVVWQAPTSLVEMSRKAFRWGRADGQAGTGEFGYARLVISSLGPALLGIVQTLRGKLSGPGILGALVAASAWKTRAKRPHLREPRSKLMLPVFHAGRVAAQTAGWVVGYRQFPERDSWPMLGRRIAVFGLTTAKRLIRPFVPDAVMLKLRSVTPTGGRHNVDVLVQDPREVDRWIASTPDTYRCGLLPEGTDPPIDLVFIPDATDEATKSLLRSGFHDDRVEAAVVAVTAPPRIDLGRINEPTVDPLAVAVPRRLASEMMATDPSAALHVIRQMGLHQAIVPVDGGPPQDSRRPIGSPGAVLLCGTIPMHDVGGGSRGAQMAHELVASGYHVTYLNLFESDEAVDLGLRYAHPNLDQIPVDTFDFERYADRLSTDNRVAILELPHPKYFSVLNQAKVAGFEVVYDLMDDWSDDALGGWGYTRHDEMETIKISNSLIASAPSLVERLEKMTDKAVTLVPNAVNVRLFHPQDLPIPPDFPPGDGPVLEYHGSLYGDWFDWDALERTAQAHPGARLVIIGDDRNHPAMPPNVHFLGLKPQYLLPGYLAHSDVAIIPFEVSETTHAVSPLKVFEYLAMEVPVASVPLAPLQGLAGVYTDMDLAVAVQTALEAPKPDGAAVAEAHGWGARMRVVYESLGREMAIDPEALPIQVHQHSVTRWTPDERRI